MRENAAASVNTPKVISVSKTTERYIPLLREHDAVGMKSGLVTLMPGECVGEHSTGQHEEELVILEGAGSVEAEGLPRQPIAPGNFVYIPPETRHNVFASDQHSLRYVFIVSKIATEKP